MQSAQKISNSLNLNILMLSLKQNTNFLCFLSLLTTSHLFHRSIFLASTTHTEDIITPRWSDDIIFRNKHSSPFSTSLEWYSHIKISINLKEWWSCRRSINVVVSRTWWWWESIEPSINVFGESCTRRPFTQFRSALEFAVCSIWKSSGKAIGCTWPTKRLDRLGCTRIYARIGNVRIK